MKHQSVSGRLQYIQYVATYYKTNNDWCLKKTFFYYPLGSMGLGKQHTATLGTAKLLNVGFG